MRGLRDVETGYGTVFEFVWNGGALLARTEEDLDGAVHTILRHVRRRIVVIIGSGDVETPRLIDSYMAATLIYVNTVFFF